MSVLVDSSIWIDYFRDASHDTQIDALLDDNAVAINDLILAELIPVLKLKRQQTLVKLLKTIRRLPLVIDWNDLIEMQVRCLRKGLNRIGIPDLIIAQNAMQHKVTLFSDDKHFQLMSRHLSLTLF